MDKWPRAFFLELEYLIKFSVLSDSMDVSDIILPVQSPWNVAIV